MHFFIDHTQLPTQIASDLKFGHIDTNTFNLSTRFKLPTEARAFACQDSMMIIQESTNSALVNVILKPIEGLKIPFRSIQYYIYRGIKKDSFISGTAVTPQGINNSEFIARFWTEWNNYKAEHNQPDLPNPTPQSFGFDNALAGALDVEKIYGYSQANTQPLFVKEGEWIGLFGANIDISLEIVTGNIVNFVFDLNYVRALNPQQINVTGLTGFDLRVKREQILSFIDPAAFFGLHYNAGINVSTYNGNVKTTETKKGNDIYTLLLEKFANKNRVYLDIRSEKGYSYNFYQNYHDASNNNIKLGNDATSPTEQPYATGNWPIVYIDGSLASATNKNNLKLNLRVDDNIKPILFLENESIYNNSSKFIAEDKILNGTTTDWSKDLIFTFPNTGTGASKLNVAYYIQLYYFRQEYNPASPSTVLKNEKNIDTIFGTLDMPYLGDASYTFQHSINSNPFFIKGQFTPSDKFSYIAKSGAFYDNNRVVFYVKMVSPIKQTGMVYPASINDAGLHLEGNFNEMSFLRRSITITTTPVQELLASPSSYQKINILNITNYNDSPSSIENILILGITQNEFAILKNIIGFSINHPRFIVFTNASTNPLSDMDGKVFQKYKIGVQGVDNNGNGIIKYPSTDIFVYNTDFVFSSKEFSDAEILNTTTSYTRNYEEKIGFENKELNTNKRYEDYFIDKSIGIKTEVEGFISTLATIPKDDTNAYQRIKTLVEDSAQDIWQEAVGFVQANNNANPDDRPLYWARNKMEVALKSHPYFNGGANNTDLDNLIKLFEEKSRNYTGVDFSYATTHNLKKILITGFDPFQLKSKNEQWNPSGQAVLSMHGKLISNGYIQAMIFPVRYLDFDKGNVETYISSYIRDADMIITISQGLYRYDIERFASKYRSYTETDNLNEVRIHEFYLVDSGSIIKANESLISEFLETTLPINSMIPGSIGNTFVIYNQQYKGNLSFADYSQPNSGTTNIQGPSNREVAENGSGGDYLSNEIFFRVSLLREHLRLSNILKSGHLHVPILSINDLTKAQTGVLNVQKIISDAIQGL